MQVDSPHTFHIPVMGLGYTIDTPVKVARFGINSVVSIIQDQLLEQMRKFYCEKQGEPYVTIPHNDPEHRWKRIKAYLDLLHHIVQAQMEKLAKGSFEGDTEIVKYFRMLPESSVLRKEYESMSKLTGEKKIAAQEELRKKLVAGSIDVNIMTKIDSPAFDHEGVQKPYEYSLAAAALKGYALSSLRSSVILSAGMNPRLYAYLTSFPDFFPDDQGDFKKRIILKVSDFRSASIQGRFLAKKGIWVSEFRVESGLNCGGHAFPTHGDLLGPILEEFKTHREELRKELLAICNSALKESGKPSVNGHEVMKLSVQGGIGTANEDRLLREYYGADSTGWGSPFLLVPEATNVDAETLAELNKARPTDYFVSHASPLGVPFNNFRRSSSEANRKERIRLQRPGSPCSLGFLAFNTEFTEKPICVSSRQYQHDKIKQITESELSAEEKSRLIAEVEEKDCLCEGLSASALLCNHIPVMHQLTAVTICPGPNLAYFTGVFTLEEMVDHIYGRKNILNEERRPHFFQKEFQMYIDYTGNIAEGKRKEYLENLKTGMKYYNQMRSANSHPGWSSMPELSFEAVRSEPLVRQPN